MEAVAESGVVEAGIKIKGKRGRKPGAKKTGQLQVPAPVRNQAPEIMLKHSDIDNAFGDKELELFGDVDRVPGKASFASTMPSWYDHRAVQKMIEELERERKAMDAPGIQGKIKPEALDSLATRERKMQEILGSKPKLSPMQLDMAAAIYENLGARLRDALPANSHMQRGEMVTEEVDRITTKCFQLTKDEAYLAMKSGGLGMDKNCRVTRDGAAIIWKLCGSLLGESTDTESLRRR